MTQLSLAHIFAGWDLYEQHLVRAIAPLSPEYLALRVAPHTWTVSKIVAHIVAARVWWLCSRAGEGSIDLAPLEFWDSAGAPMREASELVHGLERTWHMIQNALDRWTPDDLEQIFPARLDDPIERSRQWIIYHVLEHDLHHGGEISCILGAHRLAAVALE